MIISGIYKIQSKLKPDRIYIGSAVNIKHRWVCHLSDLKTNKHHSKKLQNHFNKYGEFDLVYSILLGCAKEYLIPNEQFFIDSYKPYFNNVQKAGSPLGFKHSEEFCNRCSERMKNHIPWNKGIPHSQETKDKLKLHSARQGNPAWNKGKKMSEDMIQNNRLGHLGLKQSKETVQKRIKKLKGKVRTNEMKERYSLSKLGNKNQNWELRRLNKLNKVAS